MDEDGATEDTPVDEDTCLGDSGSPVIIRLSNGEDVQVGRLFTLSALASYSLVFQTLIEFMHHVTFTLPSSQVGIVSMGIGCASVSCSCAILF